MSFAVLLLAENILAIDGSFLFAFISILLLIFILNATLFRPINKVLEDREKMSGGASHEARDLIKEYDKKVMRYEDGIRNARLASGSREILASLPQPPQRRSLRNNHAPEDSQLPHIP